MEQSAALAAAPAQLGYLSPTALAGTKDGKTLFIACATGNRILRFDTASQRVVDSISVPESPSGVALSADECRLFVTCAAPQGVVCIIDVSQAIKSAVSPAQSNAPTLRRSDASTFPRSHAPTSPLPELRILARIATGHTAMAPALSLDDKTLCACNRFDNDVSMIDLAVKKEVCRIPVQREPVAADITKNGRFLLVANHLPTGRADGGYCGAVVSVIDTASNKAVKELRLPNGSGSLNDLRLSSDGKYAAVTHIVANFKRPAVRPFPDWMNGNALTVIDVAKLEVLGTFLLDERGKGAANPWGLAWSADGATLVVAHSGTHEVSIIDFPALIKRLLELPAPADPLKAANPATATQDEIELASYLHYYQGPRRRVKLPEGDLGPRAVVVVGHTAYTANYFSDTLTAIDLSHTNSKPESIPLSESGPRNPTSGADQVRKGEFYFHDATICFQGWQSCASCHPGDGRADGLNWDLLNDGIGNPKNTKSLLLTFQTPPAMWLGVRETAETAVRAGIKHILFTQQPEEVAVAIDAYLKSLKPVPSPHLVGGKLSEAARRGEEVFSRAGCAECHPPPLFTDLHQYDVGTRRGFDRPADKFDTPALVELWRTAPFLHDGSAATVRDVLTTRNPRDRHGKTSDLTKQEVEDLCAYLLSL
jgi:DNA-binding beta-propeller fold protein YncE